jgi:hypothetical protein
MVRFPNKGTASESKSMYNEVERTPTHAGMLFFGAIGAVGLVNVVVFGITSPIGALSAFGSVFAFFVMFVQYPNTRISAGPAGIRKYKAWKIGPWTWERERKIQWQDITVVDALIGAPGPAYVSVEGESVVDGEQQHDLFQIPISPTPRVSPGSGGVEQVIAYIAERVPAERIGPEVIEYLEKCGAHEEERHPKKKACGGKVPS